MTEATTDPVLTDDEKDALLDGISSGEVEVHSSNGPAYANVLPFEVGPRSRIITDSFPRLQSLNRQFAGRIDKPVEQLLNTESEVDFDHLRTSTFTEFVERIDGLSLLLEFSLEPLSGSALINLDAAAVELLVETFYGGDSDDPAREGADFFTPGEISVATLFANVVLQVTSDVWKPLDDLNFKLVGTHLSSGVIECVDGPDDVIASEFNLIVGDKTHRFHVLWPKQTVAPLLPVFDGQKRDRDPGVDAHWRRALSDRIVDASVDLSSTVGKTGMSLRDAAALKAGDVFLISNPQRSTVLANAIAVLEGRFGVHDGRYAVEARQWIEQSTA